MLNSYLGTMAGLMSLIFSHSGIRGALLISGLAFGYSAVVEALILVNDINVNKAANLYHVLRLFVCIALCVLDFTVFA